jgi:hypothetical protein
MAGVKDWLHSPTARPDSVPKDNESPTGISPFAELEAVAELENKNTNFRMVNPILADDSTGPSIAIPDEGLRRGRRGGFYSV